MPQPGRGYHLRLGSGDLCGIPCSSRTALTAFADPAPKVCPYLLTVATVAVVVLVVSDLQIRRLFEAAGPTGKAAGGSALAC